MPDPIPPTNTTTPPAPGAPSAPSRPKDIHEAMDRIVAGQTKGPETPKAPDVPRETPAAPVAPTKRTFKVKLDHEEQEIDLDAEWADEAKRKALVERFEKGYGHDRVVERERKTAAETAHRAAIDAATKAWNEFLNDNNCDVVRDPGSKHGWKVVPRQVATPAQTTPDPLATEEKALLTKWEGEGLTAAEFTRLREIDRLRAKQETIGEIEARRAKEKADAEAAEATRRQTTEAEQQAQTRREAADQWLTTETDKFIAARAKSLEGPDKDRRIARVRQLARAAAYAEASRQGSTDESVIAAAKAAVWEEADDLDLRSKPAEPAKPQPPTVVGTAPAGGGGPPDKYKGKTTAEKFDAFFASR